MDKVNVAIIEDEVEYSNSLQEYLKTWSLKNNITISIDVFTSGFSFLEKKLKYDIVFMDIVMPKIDGMETAKEFRDKDKNAVLVFITNIPSYAIKAYEYDASDYILKPISYEKFEIKMDRIFNIANQREEKNVVIPLTSGFMTCKADDIIYIDVYNHAITYHLLGDKCVDSHGTLTQLSEQLKPLGFLRCNSCYLINAHHIDYIDGLNVSVCNIVLTISRSRKKEFIQELTQFLSKGK